MKNNKFLKENSHLRKMLRLIKYKGYGIKIWIPLNEYVIYKNTKVVGCGETWFADYTTTIEEAKSFIDSFK